MKREYTNYEQLWMIVKYIAEAFSLTIIVIGIALLAKSFKIAEAIYHGGPLFVGGMVLIVTGTLFMADAVNYKFKDSLFGKKQRESRKYSKRTRR